MSSSWRGAADGEGDTEGGFGVAKTPELTGVRFVGGGGGVRKREGVVLGMGRRCQKCSSSIGHVPAIPSLQA